MEILSFIPAPDKVQVLIQLCDKACLLPVTGQLFSLGTQITYLNKTKCQHILEILLKVVLNSHNQLNHTTYIKIVLIL